MYSICLSLFSLLIILLINIIDTTNLRCHEDINGSPQFIDHCRACVIFIDIKMNTTISPRQINTEKTSSIQDLFFSSEKNRYRRHRRHDTKITIRQKCAREIYGPLYGYDQTHCFCNFNRCNSDIQRCIYEIASKRYFSCYHGSNSSQNLLEISKKCRSCRIRMDTNFKYSYECLTFGEQEQANRTYCTCQYPMCNQDLDVCRRFQQIPSSSRVNAVRQVLLTSTKSITTSTTTTITTTTVTSFITKSNTNQTERELVAENLTTIEANSLSTNETTYIQTIIIEIRNQANCFLSSFYCILSVFLLFICSL